MAAERVFAWRVTYSRIFHGCCGATDGTSNQYLRIGGDGLGLKGTLERKRV